MTSTQAVPGAGPVASSLQPLDVDARHRGPDPSSRADVVVIGGGAAGLAAATSLARFRFDVVVVDAGRPRNAPAAGVHNYLSREGIPPAELLAAGRRDLEAYGAQVVPADVTAVRAADEQEETPGPGGFVVELSDGRQMGARRVVVATGVRDELPAVPGLSDFWGESVLHCPFCHGWEARDQRIVVLATAEKSLHTVLLWARLSDDVTVVLSPGVEPTEQQWEQFAALGINVVDDGAPVEVLVTDGRLAGLRLDGGHVVDCDVVTVTTSTHPRTDFLAPLGLTTTDLTMGDMVLGTRLEVGPMGATSVPGLYVTGNAADPFAQVATAVAGALPIAAAVNASLIQEDAAAAAAARAARPSGALAGETFEPARPATSTTVAFSAAMEREVCERILGDRRHGM